MRTLSVGGVPRRLPVTGLNPGRRGNGRDTSTPSLLSRVSVVWGPVGTESPGYFDEYVGVRISTLGS